MRASLTMRSAMSVSRPSPRPPIVRADRRDTSRHARGHLRQRPLAVHHESRAPDAPGRVDGARVRSASSRRRRRTSRPSSGRLVVSPFVCSDGTCEFCLEGLQTSCIHGGFFGNPAGRRRTGRGCPGPAGGRHARHSPRRSEDESHAGFAADAVRRDGNRLPRGAYGGGRRGGQE